MQLLMNRWILLFLAVTGLLPACRKDKRPELFDMSYFVDFNIQPGLNTFDTHFYVISPLTSQLDARLTALGLTREDVVAIEPKAAYLSSIFEDYDLDFIHRISVHVFDPFDPTDRIEFLYLDPVPFRRKTGIQPFPGIADVSPWFERPFFGIEIRLDYREVTPSLIQMRLEFALSVKGKE